MTDPRCAGARGSVTDPQALFARLPPGEGRLQVVRADRIHGERHLLWAAEHAGRSFRDQPYSRDPDLELLLFLSAQRQITIAIDLLGLRQGEGNFAIYADDPARIPALLDQEGWQRDDEVLGAAGFPYADLGITATELEVRSDPFHAVAARIAALMLEKR